MSYDEDYPIRELKEGTWPPLLKEISDPPKKLYARGVIAFDDVKILAVVGSRNYSSYGKEVTRTLIAGLRGYPIAIVSGLALGIDALAHEAALNAGLYTITVPGSGIADSSLYPRSHIMLAHRILEAGGGILSEFEPDQEPAPWTFPQRNRIMAGMSHAVLIIEASEKSGTLITARLGMEYNRDILTVPGSIFSGNSYGPHVLIRDGATPVTSSADILEALGLSTQPNTDTLTGCSPEEQEVLDLLGEPTPKDALIRKLGKDTSTTNTLLSMMEIRGLIQEVDGVLIKVHL
ncbi:DNA-processing protein DprA [Patescibacteria group bacterium]|nr:DNA-processing protein DprA [Patescibacteria group bacterium]